MGKDDSRALTDLSVEELDTITTASASTSDFVLVIDADTKKISKITIANFDGLIT